MTLERELAQLRLWMIHTAVAVDLTCEGLIVGGGSAVAPALALAVAAGQVLADSRRA